MAKLVVAVAAVLALFVVTASTATAAPQKDVTYSHPSVPLVDDDGVTRNFFVIYSYKAATRTSPATTTCTYALTGDQTPNPDDGPLHIHEGTYRAPGSPAPITSSTAAIAYCAADAQFKNRVHPAGDPTPSPTG